jgi:hypothetical protein
VKNFRREPKHPKKLIKDELWRPPPDDVYKINVDASFYADLNKGGWGFIISTIIDHFELF